METVLCEIGTDALKKVNIEVSRLLRDKYEKQDISPFT